MFDEDDDYGPNPFMFARIIGMAVVPMVFALLVGLLAPMIMYILARWRDKHAPAPDPQLGLKFVLNFFRVQSYQILLLGLFMLIYAMLTKEMSKHRGDLMRPAFGFIVPAALVFGVTTALLPKTNQYAYPAVARLWNGYNLMITGLIGFIVLIFGFQLLFAKGSTGEAGRVVWALVLVYTSAWAVQGAMFARQVLDQPMLDPPSSGSSSGGDPDVPGPMQKPLA